MIKKLARKPRKLFLYDGLGALLSAILYGIVLVKLESVIGMSTRKLYTLSMLAGIYAIFSLTCYFKNVKNWRTFLSIIANANLFHCMLTMGFVYYSQFTLSKLGYVYFMLDILVILSIAILELRITNIRVNN